MLISIRPPSVRSSRHWARRSRVDWRHRRLPRWHPTLDTEHHLRRFPTCASRSRSRARRRARPRLCERALCLPFTLPLDFNRLALVCSARRRALQTSARRLKSSGSVKGRHSARSQSLGLARRRAREREREAQVGKRRRWCSVSRVGCQRGSRRWRQSTLLRLAQCLLDLTDGGRMLMSILPF